MVNVSACPRCKGEGKIIETRARRATATAAPSAAGRCACRSRPASTRATRSACRARARSGPAADPPAACTSPSTSAPPGSSARAPSCTTSRQVSIAQAALGTNVTRPDDRRRRVARDQAGDPARDRDPAPGQGRAPPPPGEPARRPACLGPGRRADQAVQEAARAARDLRSRAGEVGRGQRQRHPRPGKDALSERRRRPRRAGLGRGGLAGAVGRRRHGSGRGGQRDPVPLAPGGTSVEPAFELVDEGLGARVDPTAPPSSGPTSRARPAAPRASGRRGDRGARPPPGLRPATDRRARRRGSSTRRTGPTPGRPTSRSCGSAGDSSSGRPGGATAAQPDDVVLALDPGMAFGTGLHPTTRSAWPAWSGSPDGGDGRAAAACSTWLRFGNPGHRRRPARRGRGVGVDTDPIAIEATEPTPGATAWRRRVTARRGSLPCRRGPVRPRPGQPDRVVLVAAGRASPRAELRPGRPVCWRRASSSTARQRSRGPRGRRARRRRPGRRGRLGGARGSASGADDSFGRTPLQSRPDALVADRSAGPHRTGRRAVPAACCCRSRCAPGGQRRSRRTRSSSALLSMQARGTLVVGRPGDHRGGSSLAGLPCCAQPWLLVALAIYAVNLALAFFIQRPNLRRLVACADAATIGPGWRAHAAALRQLCDGRAGRLSAC